MDATSFGILDGLRRRFFPKDRNKVPAHVSLFHALPGDKIGSIRDTLQAVCHGRRPFDLRPDAPMFLGRGVALRYAAPELDSLHEDLSRSWLAWLGPQDRQRFRAHATIQNKVDPAEARRLFETMRTYDAPMCRVEGIVLWHYRGGPWELAGTFPFADPPAWNLPAQ